MPSLAAGVTRLGSLASRDCAQRDRRVRARVRQRGRRLSATADPDPRRLPRATARPRQRTTRRLLRHPPDSLRLVIASRADPRLSLHRLRLEGSACRAPRSADLAFTAEEAAVLFAAVGSTSPPTSFARCRADRGMGRRPAPGRAVAAPVRRRRRADPDVCRRRANGRRLPGRGGVAAPAREVSDFMLRTSVVDLISPELADALTRRADGARILETLERSNAFVSCVGEQRRLVPLPRDVPGAARSQLRHRMPEALAVQHRHAARWYAKSRAQRGGRPARDAGRRLGARGHVLSGGGWSCSSAARQRPPRT